MKRFYLWIIICAYGGFMLVYNFVKIKQYYLKLREEFADEKHHDGFLVRTPGCTIPNLKLIDGSIKVFIFEEKNFICNKGVPALVDSNLTSIYINESSLEHYNVRDTDLLKCCFQPYNSVSPKNKDNQTIEFDKKCYVFNNSVNITLEFIKVNCIYNNTEIYKDFFAFVPLKNTSLGVKRNNKKQLNVLIIGIDSVSRLNLHRQMPKTVNYLSSLKAIEMLGYNKVADNTFPNLIPVLTGLSVDQLIENCWPKPDSYFDKCPLLWNNYKNSGFTTAFGEDSARIGMFHRLTEEGFIKQPTDYFWNHFDRTAEKEIGNMRRSNVYQCIGARPIHKVLLDYISEFVKTMISNNRLFFAFFWGVSLTHDYLNKPKLGDGDYFNFLFNLNRTGILNKTALILLSDHGIRFGGIRATYHGRLEERLPFFFFRFPDWYTRKHSELVFNLKTNRRRLTTHFDLHETLLDLLNSENLTNEFISKRNFNQTRKRAYSLFDKISKYRTCDYAGISVHFCTCQTNKKINVNNTIVKEAANYVVHKHINELLREYTDCAQLELDKILDAQIKVNSNDLLKAHFSEDYIIILKTKPSGAIFETTVRKFTNVTRPKDNFFHVAGSVSRINLYGKQSECITNRYLKLYCYCKQYLSNH